MSKIGFKWHKCLVGLLMLLSVSAGAATDIATARQLSNALINDTETRVIVSLQAANNDQQEGFIDGRGRSAAHTSRLKIRQEGLLGKLQKGSYRKVKKYKHFPQVAMTVNRKGLQQLLSDPSVSVQADVRRKLLLAQSVPHIYPNQSTSGFDGNGWAVAFLDTGIDKAHPFLAGKVVSEACYSETDGLANETSLCLGGVVSSTAVGSGLPCSGISGCAHGTFLAGIATGSNGLFNGNVLEGVATSADLISIKVVTKVDETLPADDVDFCAPLDVCLAAWTSNIIAGLDRVYALRNSHNIAAVNISLGEGLSSGTCDGDPEKPAIDLLRAAGIATIVAVGNDGLANVILAPACISSAIAVGATSDAVIAPDTRTPFSNDSSELDIYAPGMLIASSIPDGPPDYVDNAQGTSMAAAHVSGAWAVLKEKHPQLSIDALLTLIQQTGATVSGAGVGNENKRIDVAAALSLGLVIAVINADEDSSGDVSLNDTLTYTITLSNTGTSTMTNVQVADSLITPPQTCPMVAASGSCVLSGTHVVSLADVSNGEITNTSSVEIDSQISLSESKTIEIGSDGLCFPVKAANNKIAMICL